MPNWCFNKVTVTGDKKKMDVFKNKAFVNDEFKFQNLIPMPKELLDTRIIISETNKVIVVFDVFIFFKYRLMINL